MRVPARAVRSIPRGPRSLRHLEAVHSRSARRSAACRASSRRCRTSSRRSIRRPTRRSAPPACGSSRARPACATCVSTTSSTSAAIRSRDRRRGAPARRQLHASFRSWPLALTAYNHGARRHAQRRGAAEDHATSRTIVEKYQSRTFGFASRNFYAAFLAALEIDTQSRAATSRT